MQAQAIESTGLVPNMEYDRLYAQIAEHGYKKILIQLPDGLKPKAGEIQMALLKKFPELKITFWAGDCFGACDTPDIKGFDLFVAFGHSTWKY